MLYLFFCNKMAIFSEGLLAHNIKILRGLVDSKLACAVTWLRLGPKCGSPTQMN
jgi:hypothetical protein